MSAPARVSVPARPDTRFRAGMAGVEQINAAGLERHLRRHVRGEVRFDAGSRGMYANDSSNFRQPPVGVVLPETVDDVVAAVAACRAYRAPVLSRGCGTSLSGETVNAAVVVDHSKYLTGIEEIRAGDKLAVVQAGVPLDHLRRAAGEHGLTFGPDPSTHQYCTIGGMLGNNSCGTHSVLSQFYGPGPRTSDNVHSLDIVTYDGARLTVGPAGEDELARIIAAGGRRGEIYAALRDLRDRYADLIRARMPDIPRRVSGYNLDELLPERGFNVARALVGTEGTCATVLRATLMLTGSPRETTTVVVGYPDVFHAADHVAQVLAHRPMACEGLDEQLVKDQLKGHTHIPDLGLLPEGQGWLLVEFGGGTKEEADARAQRLLDELRADPHPPVGDHIFDDEQQASRLWQVREAGLGATAFPPGENDHWPGWEDSAVAPDKLPGYLRDLVALYDSHGLRGAVYGHFGQGCIHSRISFDLYTAEGVRRYRAFLEDAADLVVSYGGSLSGEHGDGQQRAELLEKMYGPELVRAFAEFKTIWDPDWKMNPGKVALPYRLDENLKFGPDFHPDPGPVYFGYPEDGGSFAHAALRCVGAGKCRERESQGTMCPSFQVLKEEKHTTRGRARLLLEMLQGDIVTGGWRDEDVYDALHLCLSCKGCTNECPVNVDMPTLKAEFLAHHYAGRLRPRAAYAMGLIMFAARAASHAPQLANFASSAPVLSRLVKLGGGVAPQRAVPRFAAQPFRTWHARRRTPNPSGPPVMLWPDTFNNYFKPEAAIAATRVLEDAGFRVLLPQGWVCCGRPLYDYGFLGLARSFLRRSLTALRPALEQGIPVVGVEPSCLAVFRDELPKMLPADLDARRLTKLAFTFGDFLAAHAPAGWSPPRLERTAMVHGHCHHKNLPGGLDGELSLLGRMGLRTDVPDTGCCGMAGSFGFEKGDRYQVSVASGERVLLPAVRDADPATLIIADGFSCKEQIRQHTPRRALHLAEAMALAMEHGPGGPDGGAPEQSWPETAASPARGALMAGAGAAGVAAAAWAYSRARR